jgi:hypothetical protein
MVRRLLACVVIAACTGAGTLLAAERATFIFSDGSRVSGTVEPRGVYGNRDNFGRGDLYLVTDDGRQVPVRLNEVAVIQFAGGRPSAAELDSLSYDNTQMLVMRNGSTVAGRFVDINQNGDLIRWQARNGRQQTIPVRELTRIYLNPDRARSAFNYGGSRFGGRNEPNFRDGNDRFGNQGGFDNNDRRGTDRVGDNNNGRFGNNNNNNNNNNNRSVGTAGAANNGNVQVAANQAWTNSGLNVRAGDMIEFRTTGRINFGTGGTQNAGPDGNDTLKSPAYPVAAMPVGGLIGRVGNSAPFPIGSNAQPIRMPANGTLMLGVNDNELGDNSGAFTVSIVRR